MMYRCCAKIFRHHPTPLLQKTGFSVAFGSTECSGSAGGCAPFTPLRECRRHKLLGGSGKFIKTGLSKMQFPAFPAPELGNQKGLLSC